PEPRDIGELLRQEGVAGRCLRPLLLPLVLLRLCLGPLQPLDPQDRLGRGDALLGMRLLEGRERPLRVAALQRLLAAAEPDRAQPSERRLVRRIEREHALVDLERLVLLALLLEVLAP